MTTLVYFIGLKQTTLDLNYNLLSFGLIHVIEVEMLKTQ